MATRRRRSARSSAASSFVAWYPITPASSLSDALNKYLPKLRTDPETGKATFAIIQAEDELAALGMVVGAGWAGARAMTSTSGPGLDLMAEFAGLAYFAEVPAVIWDIQRIGPSTGLPTRTSQGDILAAYYLSHGDTRHVLLFPADPKECFEFGIAAFDLAERLQTLVIGAERPGPRHEHLDQRSRSQYPEKPMDRGKVLTAEAAAASWAASGAATRMWTATASAIARCPARRIPAAAYFTRGTGHNEMRQLQRAARRTGKHNLDRLARKFETARRLVPGPVVDVVAGRPDRHHQRRLERPGHHGSAGSAAGGRASRRSYMRLRALPINDDGARLHAQLRACLRGGEQPRRPVAPDPALGRAAVWRRSGLGRPLQWPAAVGRMDRRADPERS